MLATIRRGLGPLGAREGYIALAILLVCGGAAIGAATNPKPEFRFGAEATIAVRRDAVNTGAISSAQLQVAHYASAVVVPQVISDARSAARSSRSASEIAHDMTVVTEPGPQLVLIRVHDASEAAATALANALAVRALDYVFDRTFIGRGETHVLGAFEDPGPRQWGAVTSTLASPPADLRAIQGSARFGSGKLRVTCRAVRTCGASVRVYGSFRKRRTYTAEAWIRSKESRVALRLVFGSSTSNRAVSRPRRLTPSWQRVVVSWTPRRHAVWADVVIRTAAAAPSIFEIDGVRLVHQDRAIHVAPPARLVRTTPSIGNHGSAIARALTGALGGLVVAVGAIGLGGLARRRRARADGGPPSDVRDGTLCEEAKR